MLVLVGEMRGVSSETIQPKDGQSFEPFVRHTATVMIGKDGNYAQEVQLAGRDIVIQDLPARGESVAFEVSIETSLLPATDRFPAKVVRRTKAWRRAVEVEALFPTAALAGA